MNRLLRAALALVVALLAAPALAHSSSTSYLQIDAAGDGALPFTWRLSLRDADALLDLDADADGRLTWGEVEDRAPQILQLAGQAITLGTAAGRCATRLETPRWQQIDGNGHLVLAGRAACPAAGDRVQLDYRLFAGIDASHRALVRVPGSPAPASLAPGGTLDFAASGAGAAPDAAPAGARFAAMASDGVLHILGGLDHLLFLVALMLPAVLERRERRWVARADLRSALLQVAWIATAFTVAHSITLGLASFGVLRVPARIIEPLIAATVLATALNNLWPLVTTRLALAAFGFGLVHGFGFAEVLAPLDLPAPALAQALLAFNIGVEGGQLIVVVGAFALLTAARRWSGYPRWILGGGSAALALLACAWIVERVFDLSLLPA